MRTIFSSIQKKTKSVYTKYTQHSLICIHSLLTGKKNKKKKSFITKLVDFIFSDELPSCSETDKCAPTHTRMRARPSTHTHTHSQPHTHAHTHTRTHARARTHARTHAYTHTHTHTHTPRAVNILQARVCCVGEGRGVTETRCFIPVPTIVMNIYSLQTKNKFFIWFREYNHKARLSSV